MAKRAQVRQVNEYHVIAHECWPVFMVHTHDKSDCDDLCKTTSLTDDEYRQYLEVMASFKAIQEKLEFPVS